MLAGLGAGAALAMPPLHLAFLLFPAISGLIWAVARDGRARDAFMTGWWFGLGHGLAGYYWVSSAFLVDAAAYGFLAPFAVAGLAAGLALFHGLTGLAAWSLWQWRTPPPVGRVLSFAALWTAAEWLRAWILTGFPWNLAATVWVFSPEMLQAVSVAGPYGLGMLSIAVAGLPALFLLGCGRRAGSRALIVGLAVLVAVWAAGRLRLAGAPEAAVGDIRLRLVQPNIAQHLKWQKELRIGHVRKQIRLSRGGATGGAASTPAPTHVIWAETAVPYDLAADEPLRRAVAAAAPADGLLITGAPRVETGPDGRRRAYNAIHALDAAGRIVATYDKRHLVPFGEYVPFPRILRFSKLTAGRVDFHPGTTPRVFDLPGLPPVAMLICYEVIFPGKVRSVEPRPAWLLNLTNDAWFGLSAGPHQHLSAAQLRAAELGLPLVRVANTGVSAVIDAHGRIRAHLELGRDGALDSTLPKAAPPTLYARFGPMLTAVFLIFGLAMTWLPAGWRSRRGEAGRRP